MTAPIPLAAPDGTVYAYVCGECSRVLAPDDIDTLDECEAMARGHCASCPACRLQLGEGVCRSCQWDGRLALQALACIGTAVAVAQHTSARVMAVLGGRRMLPERERLRDEALAALCGVSPETVRGWRDG